MDMSRETKNETGRGVLTVNPWIALLLIILGVQFQAVTAQEERSGGDKLTLAGAVDLALTQNLDIQIANIQTAARQQDRTIARSELLPHASFEVDDSVNRHNLRALLGIEIPIASVPHSIGPYEAVHVGPTFSAPVFDLALVRQY
jgi:outer membrane protein TolC